MTEYKIQSKNFLPDSIRDYDFYTKLTEILDYVLDLYHTKNIDILKALYDIKNTDFDAEKILELLGSQEFVQFNISGEQLKTLCVLLSNLYEIKGTKRGLQYLLRLLDMECNVYEWYDINRWYQEGDPKWTQPVDPCTVVIELGLEHSPIGICGRYDKWALPRTGSPAEAALNENQAFEDTEGKFHDFATRLLWVCVTLTEIRWAKKFTDYVDISSVFQWESAEVFYDKYSPYVFNCPETIIVGFPVYQEYPYVGDSVNVGDYTYKEYPFVVRSIQEYNSPINYDGWLQTGFVGYSHQVISENPPLVGDSDLFVGDQGYFWAWGYSESAQKEYLLWQRLLVGELWIEGDISPVGLNRVSGCQVSYIHTNTETAFENDYHVRRGIIVGYDDVVLPPDNTGDSYVVDDHQGDILEVVAISNEIIEEEIPISEETSLDKETEFASNISDLYEPFLVGDPTKFVGDTNLFVGQDYFFTWFEAYTDTGFVEQFYTTCLQVGSWGHGYTEGATEYILVGNPNLIVSSTHFVGEGTTPTEYFDRHPLLYVGTYLIIGSGIVVDSSIKVGQGFNYVGELSPWDNTDFVVNSNNIIYEWLESTTSPEIIEEEIPIFEQLETNLSEFELNSNIRDSLWSKVVGNGFVGDSNVEEDQYSILEIEENNSPEDTIFFNIPAVQQDPYTYSIERNTVGESDVGDENYLVGGFEIIIQDPSMDLGERHLSTLFVGNATVGQTSFTPETPNIPNSVIANSYLTCFIDDEEEEIEVFSNSVTITDDTSPEINNATEDSLSTTDSLEGTPDEENIESFNVNETTAPVIMGSEEDSVIILPPEGEEINPVYLSGEQTQPYVYDPTFNPTNAITDTISYLIDET